MRVIHQKPKPGTVEAARFGRRHAKHLQANFCEVKGATKTVAENLNEKRAAR
jgi:hypothetical protein